MDAGAGSRKPRVWTLAGYGTATVLLALLLVNLVAVLQPSKPLACALDGPAALEELRRDARSRLEEEVQPLERALRSELEALRAERAAFQSRVAALGLEEVEGQVRALDEAVLDLRGKAATIAEREAEDLAKLDAGVLAGDVEGAEIVEGEEPSEEVRGLAERLEAALARVQELETQATGLDASTREAEMDEVARECLAQAEGARRTSEAVEKLRGQLDETLTKANLADFLRRSDIVLTLQRAITAEVAASREAACPEPATLNVDMAGVVEAAIRRFVADGASEPDYALSIAGAKVLAASEIYTPAASLLPSKYSHLLGWENGAGGPGEAIAEGRDVGRCFAMAGNAGFLTVQLAAPTTIHGFSLEHADASYSWNTATAPREVRIMGLDATGTGEGDLLAQVEYQVSEGPDYSVAPVQFFPVDADQRRSYAAVRVEVLSNHGADEYTCLYRIRVHGTPEPEATEDLRM